MSFPTKVVAANGVEVEGDYSSYSLQWHEAVSDIGIISGYYINETGDRLFVIDASSTYTYGSEVRLSDGVEVAVFHTYYGGYDIAEAFNTSVLHKYMVRTVDGDYTKVLVYKDGALLQTITVPTGARVRYNVIISPNGKYIIALDDWNDKLICYEGS